MQDISEKLLYIMTELKCDVVIALLIFLEESENLNVEVSQPEP